MSAPLQVQPIASPWGRFHLYTFFIDAPRPAVVDTGIATSPAEGMAPALAGWGRRMEDVRWILLTHGHIDHVGGAHALWQATGREAEVVIHADDAPLLRSRRAHVEHYLDVRADYLRDPSGEAAQTRAAEAAIAGEFEPTRTLRGGEELDLGGGVTARAHTVPGHTSGALAYEVRAAGSGERHVFVGDAVQVHGAANGFPGYEDPDAYRASLLRLRDEIDPTHMYLGHPYRNADGEPYGVALGRDQAREALGQSLALEARIRDAAHAWFTSDRYSPGDRATRYAPFEGIARQLGYAGDPTLEPSPFFTTCHGYRAMFAADH